MWHYLACATMPHVSCDFPLHPWFTYTGVPVRAPRCNSPLIRFFDFSATCIICLFLSYASPLILFFFTFSLLISFLTYLFLWEQTCSFPGWMSWKATEPGFSLCLFCVVVHFFWLVNACFCSVLGLVSFSIPSQRDRLGETSLKWPILC